MKDNAKIFFNIGFDTNEISELTVSFYQNGEPILVKNYADMRLFPKGILITLNSSEMALFDTNQYADVQVNLTDSKGVNYISKVLREYPEYLFKIYDR